MKKIGEWRRRTIRSGRLVGWSIRLSRGINLYVRHLVRDDEWIVFLDGTIDRFVERDADVALRRALVAAGIYLRAAVGEVAHLTEAQIKA